MPCIQDCNGHGTCKDNGECDCEEGWFGRHANIPDTCEYKMKGLALDHVHSSRVRVGDWDFYEVVVGPDQAYERTLMIQFNSQSPHSYPLMLVRRETPPHLREGLLPTYDAFTFDWGDEDGFELLQGQRQMVRINSTELAAGTYVIGIFNLWGHNVIGPYNSHDTCNYEIYFNLYAAGVPCPRANGEFCNGRRCDFNTGRCECPGYLLGKDCGFETTTLTATDEDGQTLTGSLEIDEAQYFYIQVAASHIAMDHNLLITLTKVKFD